MKKIICLLLVAVMVLGLCACGSSEKDKGGAKTLRVGYGRESIHPTMDSVPLGGYGNVEKRRSQGFLDYLYATCIAITDENDNTVLLFTEDLVQPPNDITPEIRKMISEKTGVPVEQVMIAATHTHSAPDIRYNYDPLPQYKQMYKENMVKAAVAAMEDRAPAQIYTNSLNVDGMNFVRHYLMNDGTYAGDNFGDASSGYKEHAAENDPLMQLVKFTREGKDDVVLVNWQAHPCMTGGTNETNVSADFIGSTRTYVEEKLGCNFAYFTGAAGNQNAKSYIQGETPTTDYKEFGQMLGDYVIKGLENMTKMEGTTVKSTKYMYSGTTNTEDLDKLEDAKYVSELFKQTDRATAHPVARERGFESVYHANAIVSKVSWPKTMDIELYAISVGNLSFVTGPFEMFTQTAKYIKSETPFDMTVIITCANGTVGYLPSMDAFAYNCYEAYTCKFGPGIAEAVADQYLTMLKDLKK